MSQSNEKSYIETNNYLDKKYHQALLFDFYGELLKSNNKEIYEDYILNDLSLSEIADERGVSRQGIHDTIKRTSKRLEEYESKIHLLKRYGSIQDKVENIQSIISDIKSDNLLCEKDNKSISDSLLNRLTHIEEILKDIMNET